MPSRQLELQVTDPVATFFTDGYKVVIEEVKLVRITSRKQQKPRAYAWQRNYEDVSELMAQRYYGRAFYRKVLTAAGPALLAQGIDITGARWSQHAGCSCPCSPGFILAGSNNTGYDVHIGYMLEKMPPNHPEWQD
jgi:hypothetical protein